MRKAEPIILTEEERAALQKIANTRTEEAKMWVPISGNLGSQLK